jgi:hypothetical protein
LKNIILYEEFSDGLTHLRSVFESLETNPIANIEIYNRNMEASYPDKLFFMDIINPDVVVDFGCADGTILSKMKEKNPNVKLIGYDLSKAMLDKAKAKLGPDVFLTDSWAEVQSELSSYSKPALVLSSVIHEVYSYSLPKEVKKFWENRVFGGDFKWIVIRDMIPSVEMGRKEATEFQDDVDKVKAAANPKYLKSYEENWDDIGSSYKFLAHFLLKYKFTDNWAREVAENYLPLSLETLYKKIPPSYKIIFEENFVLPYLKKEVKKDFDVDIKHTTHAKMILENTEFIK